MCEIDLHFIIDSLGALCIELPTTEKVCVPHELIGHYHRRILYVQREQKQYTQAREQHYAYDQQIAWSKPFPSSLQCSRGGERGASYTVCTPRRRS